MGYLTSLKEFEYAKRHLETSYVEGEDDQSADWWSSYRTIRINARFGLYEAQAYLVYFYSSKDYPVTVYRECDRVDYEEYEGCCEHDTDGQDIMQDKRASRHWANQIVKEGIDPTSVKEFNKRDNRPKDEDFPYDKTYRHMLIIHPRYYVERMPLWGIKCFEPLDERVVRMFYRNGNGFNFYVTDRSISSGTFIKEYLKFKETEEECFNLMLTAVGN